MIELEQYVLAGFVLIGLVNGIQFATNKEWKSLILFLTAVVAGTIFGAIGWFGLPNAEMGLAVGLASSGVFKTASKIGTFRESNENS
jgi:hydrogenase/urease accessory protein HupE